MGSAALEGNKKTPISGGSALEGMWFQFIWD
jgi:hypothetical protein